MTAGRLATLAPVVAFAALAAGFVATVSAPAPTSAAGYLDRPLPEFEQGPLPGYDHGLASREIAGKVSVINVFASWCSSCRAEHPDLMRIAGASDVPFYGVNWKDRPGAGKLYLERFGNPYHATGDDASGALGNRLGVTGVPETYVVDATGRIRYRHIGPLNETVWAEIMQPLIAELEAGAQ